IGKDRKREIANSSSFLSNQMNAIAAKYRVRHGDVMFELGGRAFEQLPLVRTREAAKDQLVPILGANDVGRVGIAVVAHGQEPISLVIRWSVNAESLFPAVLGEAPGIVNFHHLAGIEMSENREISKNALQR